MRIALFLYRRKLRGDLLHALGFASIVAAVSLWGRSAVVEDREARARAERLAIFVGLWPPTLFLLGKVLQDIEATPHEQAELDRSQDSESAGETVRDLAAA